MGDIEIRRIQLMVRPGQKESFIAVMGLDHNDTRLSALPGDNGGVSATWHTKLSAWVTRDKGKSTVEMIEKALGGRAVEGPAPKEAKPMASVTVQVETRDSKHIKEEPKSKCPFHVGDKIVFVEHPKTIRDYCGAKGVVTAVRIDGDDYSVDVSVKKNKRAKAVEVTIHNTDISRIVLDDKPEPEQEEPKPIGELAPIPNAVTGEPETTASNPIVSEQAPPLNVSAGGGALLEVWPETPSGARVDKHYKPSEASLSLLKWVHHHAIKADGSVRILLRGYSGCGKSALAEWFAGMTGRPYAELLMPVIGDEGAAFGVTLFKSGQSIKYWTEFARALTTPNCVILLDEVNRTPPMIMNYLMSLLDHRGRVYVPNMGVINVAKGVVFFGTANMGAAYTGTFDMDRAQRERFSYTVDCGYMETSEEIAMLMARFPSLGKDDATNMVSWATGARERYHSGELSDHISTRQLIAMAQPICDGVDPVVAAEMAIGNAFSIEDDKKTVMDGFRAMIGA